MNSLIRTPKSSISLHSAVPSTTCPKQRPPAVIATGVVQPHDKLAGVLGGSSTRYLVNEVSWKQ